MVSVGVGAGYSDYIIFADESGDPNPASVDANYPVFVLNFCVFRKDEYARSVLPAVTAFKFEHFGHDNVVLHERDIRHRNPPFALLQDRQIHDHFMDGLNELFEGMDFNIISAVIDKQRLIEQRSGAADLYALALWLGLEQTHRLLQIRGQSERITHVVMESRGRREDDQIVRALSLDQSAGGDVHIPADGFRVVFADKRTNSPGMQIADLTAGPIGRHYIRPRQANRAWTLLESKLWRDLEASANETGLTVYPK